MKKRYKNILLYGSMLMVMAVFWSACEGEKEKDTLSKLSPTAVLTVVPTKPPVNTQVVTPIIKPTEEPKITEKPVLTPTGELEPELSPTPAATVTPSPTATPTVTPLPTVAPTATPTVTPVSTVLPTSTPTVTPLPTVTSSPTVALTPTPTINPLSLVYAGWQQTTDPSGERVIVFPDIYDEVSLIKEKNYFSYSYTASTRQSLVLELSFYLEEDVAVQKEKIIEQYPEVRMKAQTDGYAYYAEEGELFVAGVVYACYYEPLGINGVVRIENRYPKGEKEEYQKEPYSWYVCVPK